MAKGKPKLTGLFDRTEPEAQEETQQDKIEPRGVGLKLSEWAELDGIARELGWKSHAIRAYAIRYFLKHYRAGKIKPETQTKKTFTLPDL